MPLPFLHRFLSANRRTKFELQPVRENTHDWPLSLIGPDGPELLKFEILGLGEPAPRKPGVFVYARKRGGVWQALYIGESADLSARLSFNEIAADALLSGATDIHILRFAGDAAQRRDLTERLILTNAPTLNEEERVKLDAVAGEEKAKDATRAA